MEDASALPHAKLLADYEGLRRFILGKLAPVPARDALRILPGDRNHLHWHLGHMLYVQSSALWVRAGEASPIPKSFRPYFGYGTSPADYDSLVPDWDELLARAGAMSRGLAAAHLPRMGKRLIKPLELMNISAGSVAEAIPFLLVHEGDHLSRIKQITGRLAKGA